MCLFAVGTLALVLRSMERFVGRLRDNFGEFTESEDQFFRRAIDHANSDGKPSWQTILYVFVMHLMTFFLGSGFWLMFFSLQSN